MKVLFAVNREEISSQIVKKYQKEYKEIIAYKNVYYFNAIIKELQRDKSYDRIIISEDLEPFANNNYDAIDKFIFDKLDNISDEATGNDGDIPIILICAERRNKSDAMLLKLFGLGIYNALLGSDRSINNLCALINKPRSKRDAKVYYNIESNDVKYQSEDENSVSETEIQNIINYYKKLGKNEEKYVESFDKIASQYNDKQLKAIIKFLPLNVKAVLESDSEKYQSLITFSGGETSRKKTAKVKENGLEIGFLKQKSTTKPVKPVIVPTAVNTKTVKKLNISAKPIKEPDLDEDIIMEDIELLEEFEETVFEKQSNDIIDINNEELEILETVEEPKKRGRGRPRKIVDTEENIVQQVQPKRGRGRPRKQPILQDEFEDDIITSEVKNKKNYSEDFEDSANILPGFDEINDFPETTDVNMLPGFDDYDIDEEIIENSNPLSGFDNFYSLDEQSSNNISKETKISHSTDKINDLGNTNRYNTFEKDNKYEEESGDYEVRNEKKLVNYNNYTNNNSYSGNNLSKDKKVVTFVGTTKNGTSFLVNNLAKCLSNMGIKTAILDLTKNRNSYYIYTNNNEKLRNIAYESIKKLNMGIANGIEVDKNLTVFTALPGDNINLNNADNIISTLSKYYSIVLIDSDFNTPIEYFALAQEIYVVQTFDILTIQPMTAFLRDLKAKNILNQEKIRIVINKEIKVRGLTSKAIIGGLAFYNDPAMSFMTELFNKDNVKFCTIPFEYETYSKYLEAMMECEINLNGYSKNFMVKLKELANMVYPLLNNNYRSLGNYDNDKFSSDINKTLQQMKNKY